MTEQYEEPTLPGMAGREILESLGPDGIVDRILEMRQNLTEIEKRMNMASVVLEGAYGLTVEDVLKRR